MNLLLDTHVVLWWLADDPRLRSTARDVIADPTTTVWVSAASAWEMSIKRATGKLRVPADLHERLAQNRFAELTVRIDHGLRAGELPPHHRDPFDRVLVAQAQVEQLTICTADRVIPRYEVPVLDATAG